MSYFLMIILGFSLIAGAQSNTGVNSVYNTGSCKDCDD